MYHLCLWLILVTRLAWVCFEISIKCVGASRSYSLYAFFLIMGSWYVLCERKVTLEKQTFTVFCDTVTVILYSGSKCFSWFLLLMVLGLLAVSVITLTVLAVNHLHSHNQQNPVLACNGDTIYLDQVGSLLYSSWSVRECPDQYDFEHVTTLHRVKGNGFVSHEEKLSFQSGRFTTTRVERDAGVLDNQYLLEGSWINYTMCLDTAKTSQLNGEFFVFDDYVDLQNFFMGTSDGTDTAVYLHRLPIGSNNQTVCTSIHYTISKTSYYYLTTKIPTGVAYMFNYTVYERYLNGTDYVPLCNVSLEHQCEVNIPNSFTNQEYTLLGSVRYFPPMIVIPPTTHICVTRNDSFFIPGVMSAVAGFLLLVLVSTLAICLCVRFCSMRRRRRQKYVAVRTEIN